MERTFIDIAIVVVVGLHLVEVALSMIRRIIVIATRAICETRREMIRSVKRIREQSNGKPNR